MTFRRALTDRGEKARQKLILRSWEGRSCFNLVAELRLLLLTLLMLLLSLFLWATSDETVFKDTLLSIGAVGVSSFSSMFIPDHAADNQTLTTTILASSTAISPADRPTMTTSVLATSTTTQQTSFSTVLATSTATSDVQTVGDPSFLTKIKTILATSKANEATGHRVAALIQQALVKSQSDVEAAMNRLEQLRSILQQDLGPSELVDALQTLGLLDDGPDQTDVLSLFEQPALPHNFDELKHKKTKHDPWWYENSGYDEHGLPLDDDDNLTELGLSTRSHGNNGSNDSTMQSDSNNATLDNRTMHADPDQLTSMNDPIRRLSFKIRTFSWAARHRLHLIYVMIGTCLILASVGFMQAPRMPFGQPQRHHNVGHDVGVATLKTPPGWSYENSGMYSLRSWLSDKVLWSTATDMEQERQAPAVALVITGAARDLIREIPPQQLRDGVWENGQHVAGLLVLCRTLARHYAPLESELQTRAMSELMGYSRMPGESIDAALTRFEILRRRAAQRGGFFMNATSLSYILLNGLRIKAESWDRLLLPLDGQLPQTDEQFQQLTERIRRVGRIAEGHFNPPQQQGATGNVGGYHYFPTFVPPYNAGNQMPDVFAAAPSGAFASVPGVASEGFSFASGLSNPAMSAFPVQQQMSDDEECCGRCGMFYMDDEFSSGTESDDMVPDNEAHVMYGE